MPEQNAQPRAEIGLRTVTVESLVYNQKPSLFGSFNVFKQGREEICRVMVGDPVALLAEDKPTFMAPYAEIRIDLGAEEAITGWLPTSALGDYVGIRMQSTTDMEMAGAAVIAAQFYETNASFLLALAQIVSGLKHEAVGEGTERRYGPFRFGEKEWNAHVSAFPEAGVTRYELGDAGAQFLIAGALSKKVVDQLASPSGLGTLPTYAQVYLGHLLGGEAAAHVLKAGAAGTASVDVALKAFYSNDASTRPNADALVAGQLGGDREAFETGGKPKTTNEVLKTLAGRLDSAAIRASQLLDAYYRANPSEDPIGSPTPWRERALNRFVTARDRKPTPEEAKEYNDAVGVTGSELDPSASTAFVAWCLANVQQPKIKLPKDPSKISSWRDWGDPVDGHPAGAIALVNTGGDVSAPIIGILRESSREDQNFKLITIDRDSVLKDMTIEIAAVIALRFPSEATGQGRLDPKAEGLIISQEVSDEATYKKKFRGAVFPGGSSGATIGIGYDVGQMTRQRVIDDWGGIIDEPMLNALLGFVGVKGDAARTRQGELAGKVDIPWEKALAVFRERTVPFYSQWTKRRVPNTEKLSPLSFGVLVSLTYNRGASYTLPGARYEEMRNIHDHMAKEEFGKVPDEIRNMKRIWIGQPQLRGLLSRRDLEATLFAEGLDRKATT